MDREDMPLEERVALLEFQVGLLFENTPASRFVFEHGLTSKEYLAIMDVMDACWAKIVNHETVTQGEFETMMGAAFPGCRGDRDFCRVMAKAFMEEGRWEKFYPTLYGK